MIALDSDIRAAYENGNVELVQYNYEEGPTWWIRVGVAGIFLSGKDMVSLMELINAMMEEDYEV